MPGVPPIPNAGNAFDSDSDNYNFLQNADISLSADTYPRNSSTTYIAAPISGYPAYGAIITCDDGLSTNTTAYQINPYGNKLARFSLPDVTTGTWTVSAFYKHPSKPIKAYQEVSNVFLATDGGVVGITNESTTPAWPSNGFNAMLLNSNPIKGFVSGKVTSNGNPVEGIKICHASDETFSKSDGMYMLGLTEGPNYAITANPSCLDAQYVEQTRNNVPVYAGQITSGQDFDISPGGAIGGRVREISWHR
jgi:hypothetical protein